MADVLAYKIGSSKTETLDLRFKTTVSFLNAAVYTFQLSL